MHYIKYLALVAMSAVVSGCALERADPSAKSARTTYGAITVTATGGSRITVTIGDGAVAAADGDGAVSQPSTQTTTQNPDLSGAAGGLSPISAGIAAATQLGGKIIDATKEVKVAKAQAEQAKAENAANAGNNANCTDCTYDAGTCPDGNCPDGDCLK